MASSPSKLSVPPPRTHSPRPSSRDGPSPRSSLDQGSNHQHSNSQAFQAHAEGATYFAESSTSSPRRFSNASSRKSPLGFRGDESDGMFTNKPAAPSSSSGPVNGRVPRIMTNSVAGSGDGGPRSAPGQRIRGDSGDGMGSGQPRSSSSPDPRTSADQRLGPQRTSPHVSPVENRPNAANALSPPLGPPYDPSSSSSTPRRPSPSPQTIPMPVPYPAPSRGSSFGDSSARPFDPHSPSTAAGPRLGGSPPGGSRSRPEGGTTCGHCGQNVRGQFVRAMGKVYHLQCFRCKVSLSALDEMLIAQDCNKVVAQKFFPIEEADGMYPLCERDYFARLGLICSNCDQALRSSYITACGELNPLRVRGRSSCRRQQIPCRALHMLRVRRPVWPQRLLLRAWRESL